MTETLHEIDGRHVLRMERRLAHPVGKVWRAITEPTELTRWFPADMDMDLAPGAKIRFAFREGEGPDTDGVITELDPPRVFAYTWDDAVLRWELRPDGDGCLLTFTHTFDDRPAAASFAAGWDLCFDALSGLLAGAPAELSRDWAELHEGYVEAFGLADGALDGRTLRFERQLTKPVEQAWEALTGAGVTAGGAVPEPAVLPSGSPGVVTAVEAPRVFEYELDEPGGRVRWELLDGPGGARAVLTHTLPRDLDARLAAEDLAAWHVQVDRLAAALTGRGPVAWSPERLAELRGRYDELVRGGP